MIEAVHGVVVVFEGGLPEVFAAASLNVVTAHHAATYHAQDENGIAVAVFAAAAVKTLNAVSLRVFNRR